MSRASAVPDVIAKLVTSWSSAVPGLSIFDGPVAASDPPAEFVAVGTSAEDMWSATAEHTPQPGPAETGRRERFSITCGIRVQTGDMIPAECRVRAYAILDQLVDVIEADPKLGGTCARATLGEQMRLLQVADEEGALADLTFTVIGLALVGIGQD